MGEVDGLRDGFGGGGGGGGGEYQGQGNLANELWGGGCEWVRQPQTAECTVVRLPPVKAVNSTSAELRRPR